MRGTVLSIVFLCFVCRAGGPVHGADKEVSWKYTLRSPGSESWYIVGFNDAKWIEGAPPFGDSRKMLPHQAEPATTWTTERLFLRGTFSLQSPSDIAALDILHGTDTKIFINGTLFYHGKEPIARRKRQVIPDTPAFSLKKGGNLIAVQCVFTGGRHLFDLRMRTYPRGRHTTLSQPATPPRGEHPRPGFRRTEWMNLNGRWEFEIDRGNTGIRRGLFTGKTLKNTIMVPYPPESPLSTVGTTEPLKHVWYHRTVSIPKTWAGKRILLHFGAVDHIATVWINAQKAAVHRGGFTPFSVDITDLIVKNTADIVLLADDGTEPPLQPAGGQAAEGAKSRGSFTPTTGIWQTVYLEPVNETRFASLRITADLGNYQVLIHTDVHQVADGLQITAHARADGESAGKTSADLQWGETTVVLPLKRLHLWSPDDPFLYELELTLETKAGKAVDRIESYFGLRSIALAGEKLLLNNRSIFQRLVLIQGYYPEGVFTASGDGDFKRDINLAAELGFNGAKLYRKVFDPRFLYWADKLGFLLWVSSPNEGIDYSSPEAISLHLNEWIDVIKRDINHPSIMGWCPFHRAPSHKWSEGIAMVYKTTKTIDPTRPVIDENGFPASSGRPRQSGASSDTSAPALFFSASNTPDALQLFDADGTGIEHHHFMVREFGGFVRYPTMPPDSGVSGDHATRADFLEEFRRAAEPLLMNKSITGFCYKQLYDVEHEYNGLYTYERKSKFAPSRIRRIVQQKAAVEE